MSVTVSELPTHPERGWHVDAETGAVYGASQRYMRRPIGTVGSHGYLVSSDNGRSFLLHRVVWETCVGPIPAGLVINHLNGVKTDNRLCNLEVVTQSENVQHAHDTGLITPAPGYNNWKYWITPDMRAGIKQMREEGFTQTQTARAYGCSRKAVWLIERGRTA